jgi:hypothetical protein
MTLEYIYADSGLVVESQHQLMEKVKTSLSNKVMAMANIQYPRFVER